MKKDTQNYTRRTHRTRTKLKTSGLPRLSVAISNQHISAQIIDDTQGHTVAQATSRGADIKGSISEKAEWVGKQIAKQAQEAEVNQVVYDRGAYRYHGHVKTLAEAARQAGLEF